MGVNKVEYGGETLIDLTNDTVTPETLAEGTTAHNASGDLIVGTMSLNKVTDLTDTTWNVPSGMVIPVGYGIYFVDCEIAHTSGGTSTTFSANKLHMGYTVLAPLAEGSTFINYAPIGNNIVATNTTDDTYREFYTTDEFTIAFTGGTDTTDTDLINLMYSIGILQEKELATVDKIGEIYTNDGDMEGVNADEYGMGWGQTFGIYDDDGNTIKSGYIGQRIPLVAGNGIQFEVDEENQVVKINTTGSDSTDESTIGTWVFKEVPSFDGVEYGVSYPVNFTTLGNGETYNSIIIESNKYGASGNFITYENEQGSTTAYSSVPVVWLTGGWDGEGFMTITINNELEDGWFKTWLKATAVKQSDTSKPCFEMPQIRFTSANGYTDGETPNFYVDGDKPLKLTVEIVGGGALQVGDALQVCHRKRFNGSQANGYKRKYKLQRFAEYIVTEEDLNNKYLTVSVACGSGGTSPQVKHAYRGLFHDGMADNIAPLYLRIRRAKGDMQNNDSGQTIDAEFSNIVTIWKHSHRGYQTIRIQ